MDPDFHDPVIKIVQIYFLYTIIIIYFPEIYMAWAQNVPVQHGHGFCLKNVEYVTFIDRAPHMG